MIYHHVQSRTGMISYTPKFNTKCKECFRMRNDSGCGVRPGWGFLLNIKCPKKCSWGYKCPKEQGVWCHHRDVKLWMQGVLRGFRQGKRGQGPGGCTSFSLGSVVWCLICSGCASLGLWHMRGSSSIPAQRCAAEGYRSANLRIGPLWI